MIVEGAGDGELRGAGSAWEEDEPVGIRPLDGDVGEDNLAKGKVGVIVLDCNAPRRGGLLRMGFDLHADGESLQAVVVGLTPGEPGRFGIRSGGDRGLFPAGGGVEGEGFRGALFREGADGEAEEAPSGAQVPGIRLVPAQQGLVRYRSRREEDEVEPTGLYRVGFGALFRWW